MTSLPQVADEPDDAHLVARVRAGDAGAFDVLARRYSQLAFGLAYRVTGGRADAEDVVQEAFMAALHNIDSFDTARPFAPWFSRIVVNRALNLRKQQVRHPTVRMTDDLPGTRPSAAAEVEVAELRERLRVALSHLPERRRTIVQLAGFDGLTSAEIGDMLGIPAGTVRYELHEARAALRAALAPCREVEA